jgi:hypothetical protein
MNLDVTADEQDALLDILQRELSRLKGEIYHTDDREFKAGLKVREAIIVDLIDRLGASAQPAA